MRRYEDIVERVEIIRNHTGLNKAQFAAAIGLKPQTYNNFVGAQGSKPSIDLIHGVVRQFQVDPMWLLVGRGPMYRTERAPDGVGGNPTTRSAASAAERIAQMGRVELVREVLGTLEELQVLLARLRGHFSAAGQENPYPPFN